MEALGLFWLCVALIAYCGAAFLTGWLATPQLGERYGYNHGTDSESRLLRDIWLVFMAVGAVLSLLLMVFFVPDHLSWASRFGAMVILTVFAPVPVAMAVTRTVGEHLSKGDAKRRADAVSQYTA